jgi:hypothetical protein
MEVRCDAARLRKIWLSQLATPGTLLRKRGSSPTLVIYSDATCFVGMRVELYKRSDFFAIKQVVDSSNLLSAQVIEDPAEWTMVPVGPCCSLGALSEGEGASLRLQCGGRSPLLEHCADHGFKTLNMTSLKKLYDELTCGGEGR